MCTLLLTSRSVPERVALFHAECAAMPSKAGWQERAQLQCQYRAWLGLTYRDIIDVDTNTYFELPTGDALDTAFPPGWFTPALLDQAERQAAKTLDYAISEQCGESATCPIHQQEYILVSGILEQDCRGCFEEVGRREKHAYASAMARQAVQEMARQAVQEREALPQTLPCSGVEVSPVSFTRAFRESFARQQADDLKTFGALTLSTLAVIGVVFLIFWQLRHGG